MNVRASTGLAVLAACVLGACAAVPPSGPEARDTVILLPGADGASGAVTVRQGDREALLDAPFASATTGADGRPSLGRADPAATRETFARALEALPPAPLSYTVFFVFGQDELTEESRLAIGPVLKEIAERTAPEVAVIGHADQVGAERVNEALSLRRAERVKALLVARGVSAERIATAGRGAREPLVHAGEATPEARNRRVEIIVR